MAEKEIRGWFDREITEPEHMEASLRYAVLLPTDFLGHGSFTFPWYKKINTETYFLYFRRAGGAYSLRTELSLDLGRFEESGEKFDSSAWIDFRATNYLHGFVKNDFGEVSREDITYASESLWVRRLSYAERKMG